VNTPVCPVCPKGYKSQPNKNKCCPDCIPTDEIPNVCKVKNSGSDYLLHEDAQRGSCTSDKKYKLTGCAGICGSSVQAQLGTGTFIPSCSCCQPTNVKKHNVTMTCDDKSKITTTYYEILSCSCGKVTCASTFNMDNVHVEDTQSKRSLFESLDEIPDMDDDTLTRQRRTLLNDLALLHAKKKKK